MPRSAAISSEEKDCVENAAYRMTCPGLGKEVGASLGVNQFFLSGICFLAPTVAKGALKGAVFAANIYEKLGLPGGSERHRTHVRISSRRSTLGTPEVS